MMASLTCLRSRGYMRAIARGHAFSDANKRTALVSALTYLLIEGYEVARTQALEEIMVDVAEGKLNYLDIANIFSSLAKPIDPPGGTFSKAR